jgi:hypothetical protein
MGFGCREARDGESADVHAKEGRSSRISVPSTERLRGYIMGLTML